MDKGTKQSLITLISPENPKASVAVKYYSGYPDLNQALNVAGEIFSDNECFDEWTRTLFVIWLYCLSPRWGITKDYREKKVPLRNIRIFPTLYHLFHAYIQEHETVWAQYYPTMTENYLEWLEKWSEVYG